jgi:hypothetical protein
MNSLTDLREVVDVVIGVDTHVHTHSAAVVDTATGGVRGEITVEATTEGYAEVVEFANNHAMLRAWAIEGTGGHGAGLCRHLRTELGWRPARPGPEILSDVVAGMADAAHGTTPALRPRTVADELARAFRQGPVAHRPKS